MYSSSGSLVDVVFVEVFLFRFLFRILGFLTRGGVARLVFFFLSLTWPTQSFVDRRCVIDLKDAVIASTARWRRILIHLRSQPYCLLRRRSFFSHRITRLSRRRRGLTSTLDVCLMSERDREWESEARDGGHVRPV